MNRKQLLILLAALAIIGSAGLVLLKQNKNSWMAPQAKMGDKVFPDFKFNDVTAIRIKGETELNIARKNDVWVVRERNDYPANFHQLSDILIKIRDLKVVQAETVTPSEVAQVNLEELGKGSGSGTLVEFRDSGGKVIDSLLLGKMHVREASETSRSPFGIGSPDGRYILLRNDPGTVLLISDPLSSLAPMPEVWLSKDFFKAEKIKAITVALDDAAKSWKTLREAESSPWTLVDTKPGESLDGKKISMIADMLQFPNFVDVMASNAVTAACGLDKPTVVTVETFEHFVYTLKIGGKDSGGNYFSTVSVAAEIPLRDGEETKKLNDKFKQEQSLAAWIYLINPWFGDQLMRDRSQILVAKEGERN